MPEQGVRVGNLAVGIEGLEGDPVEGGGELHHRIAAEEDEDRLILHQVFVQVVGARDPVVARLGLRGP